MKFIIAWCAINKARYSKKQRKLLFGWSKNGYFLHWKVKPRQEKLLWGVGYFAICKQTNTCHVLEVTDAILNLFLKCDRKILPIV